MSYRKRGFGLVGLLTIAALAVMALASTAQAVTPQFAINGVKAGTATIKGTQEEPGSLLVPGLNVSITCEQVSITDGLILNSVDAHATALLYEGCTVKEHKSPFAALPCHVSDVHTGNPSKLHITALNPLILPVELPGGDFGILAENISVAINFLSGTGCPLPLKTVLTGQVCALIEPATNDTKEPLVLFSETIQKTCPEVAGVKDKLLFGGQEAFIVAKAILTDTLGRTLGVLLL